MLKLTKDFLDHKIAKGFLEELIIQFWKIKKKGENDLYNNKITKNNFNINQKSIMINKNKDNFVPYYGKRQFRAVSFGKGSYTFA